MRFINSLKNASAAWVSQIILLLVKFLARSFFVYYLSEEYLGLNGLFSNILSVLSLAELGVGTAIVFSLYKPISETNTEDILSIMRIYKSFYIFIGIFVLFIGISITPFLPFFIKEFPKNIVDINLIYILYVINTSISYFFSYKSSYIIANQKNYMVTLNNLLFSVVLNIVQIVVLAITRNFKIYLCVQILFTFFENLCISKIADSIYPVLKQKAKYKLKPHIKKEISRNIIALLFHKIGSVVVFSTDNLIISKMIGLVSVGIYSNYSMIINSINSIITQVFSSVVASVGNLRLDSSMDKQKNVYFLFLFIDFLIFSFATICLINLLNPFIEIWVGEKYLFSFGIVVVLSLNFYITGLRKATTTFKDAYGLFWYNKYMPIYESITNLILSIMFTKYLGVIGVFIGTMVSSLLTCVWIEPYVLFKQGFGSNTLEFWKKYVKYFMCLLLLIILSLVLNSIIVYEGVFGLIIKFLICLFTESIIVVLMFFNNKEFKNIIMYLKKYINIVKCHKR